MPLGQPWQPETASGATRRRQVHDVWLGRWIKAGARAEGRQKYSYGAASATKRLRLLAAESQMVPLWEQIFTRDCFAERKQRNRSIELLATSGRKSSFILQSIGHQLRRLFFQFRLTAPLLLRRDGLSFAFRSLIAFWLWWLRSRAEKAKNCNKIIINITLVDLLLSH